MQRDDDVLAFDIVYAAQRIKRFSKNLTLETFQTDEMANEAIQHGFIVIGEAVRHLSERVKDSKPNIPWSKLVGFRNILVHAYFGINLERVWNVITEDLDELIAALEPLIPPSDTTDS